MPLPRPFLSLLALPTLALAAQLTPWEIASTAAAAMALDAALRRGHREMLGWSGLALGAGLAGLILLPFVAALLIARRVPLRLWPVLPLVAALLVAPDFPIAPTLAEHVPNLWALLPLPTLSMLGLACTATIGAAAAYMAQFSVLARSFDRKQLTRLALLAALLVPLLMPGVAPGAFLLAGLLALPLAGDREGIETAALVQAGLALGMLSLGGLGALALVAAALRTARPLLWRAANDNPILAHA